MCMHSGMSLKRGKNYIGKDRLKKIINEECNAKLLPKDWEEWIRNFALRKDHYIYFYSGSDGVAGYCTNCRSIVNFDKKPKQLSEGKCPSCGIVVNYSNNKYRGKCVRCAVSILQPCFEGVVERRFSVNVSNTKDFEEISIWEFERVYYGRGCYEGEKRIYTYHQANCDWLHGYSQKSNEYSQYLYPNNLDFVCNLPDMKYCGIKEYALNCEYIDAIKFIKNFEPIVEKLLKVGLCEIAKYIAREGINGNRLKHFDRNAQDLQRFLNLVKIENIRLAIKHNTTTEELFGMQIYEKRLNRPLNDTEMREIQFLVRHNRIEYGDVKFKYSKYISVNSFIDYFNMQKDKWKGMGLRDYEDYIGACEKLGYDLTDTQYLKPKDFKKAHDETLDAVRLENDKLVNLKLGKIANNLIKKLRYEKSGYVISMPKTTNDLINESKALNHCVKNYADRIANGTSLIFFIRKNDNLKESFYTLELDPKNEYRLVQCRTHGNNVMTKEVQKFVDKWLEVKVCTYVESEKKKSAKAA